MKVQLKVAPKVIVEAESEKQTEIFEQLHSLQEVFGQSRCGKCGNEDSFKYVVREVDDNKFYELRCEKCRAKITFGAHKRGNTLFPKRKDDEGEYLPDNGWLRWNKDKKTLE